MRIRSVLTLLALLLGLPVRPAPPARAAASLELYGTFHAMGIIVTLMVADTGATPPDRWYTVPITATGDGFMQTASVRLLVGGSRVYLPTVLRD